MVTVGILPQWHEDGKCILLHTKLYEDEIQRHQELFPELKNLKSISVLQAWLATYGFKARTKWVPREFSVPLHSGKAHVEAVGSPKSKELRI